MGKLKSIEELESLRQQLLAAEDPDRPVVRVCLGPGCLAQGADKVSRAFRAAIKARRLKAEVKPLVKETGCHGFCSQGTLVSLAPANLFYVRVKAEDVKEIVETSLLKDRVVERLLYTENGTRFRSAAEIPFYRRQQKIILKNVGVIDPLDIKDALAAGAYRSLAKALTAMSPDEVIRTVEVSGLRGRGGGGFPTGFKWKKAVEHARENPGAVYIIANGEEGDPGAFMDRAVLEADPFRVIEGLTIAAYAVGAAEGFLYVRREYPIAVSHVREAIRKAEEQGYLGENIVGGKFSFRLQVREGAGAFVCGEETALIQSIEGERGMPRLRPPYPAQSGLWGRPTLINNVETLACLPWILRHGPEAFAALGTEKSKGTKVFSLAGKINRGGLIEVSMGIPIREIVYGIGGGIRGGREFKAVLVGGPSGGCIPARLADTRVDYEELASTGSIMGSGGLVVLDDRDCAVEIARYFLQFTQNESCGKCTFCRIGTKRMLEILQRICAGKGVEADLRTLEDLSRAVKQGSLCGLGQTAPNPVLTTLRYFREEYEAHIRERRCPAAQCKALIHYSVLESCTGCTLCAQACPVQAILPKPYERHAVIDELCTRCGMCVTACPESAIDVG